MCPATTACTKGAYSKPAEGAVWTRSSTNRPTVGSNSETNGEQYVCGPLVKIVEFYLIQQPKCLKSKNGDPYGRGLWVVKSAENRRFCTHAEWSLYPSFVPTGGKFRRCSRPSLRTDPHLRQPTSTCEHHGATSKSAPGETGRYCEDGGAERSRNARWTALSAEPTRGNSRASGSTLLPITLTKWFTGRERAETCKPVSDQGFGFEHYAVDQPLYAWNVVDQASNHPAAPGSR